jgi:hypothetical protein
MCTDQSALIWLLSFKNLGEIARWIQRLSEYSITSEHRQGRDHNNALSRRPRQKECTHCHKIEGRAHIKYVRANAAAAVAAASWALATLRADDSNIGPILHEVEIGQRSKWKNMEDRSPTYKS